jgi:hypothetical protein
MKNEKAFSVFKGFSFVFTEGEDQIVAWFSAFSGKEKVFVNGTLVSEQRNYSTNSTNTFSVGNNSYSTNLLIKSLFKGPFICTLFKNGREHKRQKLIFPTHANNKKSFFLHFLIFLFVGILFGFAHNYFKWPDYSIYLLFLAVFALSFASTHHDKNSKAKAPVIVEDDI